MESKYSSVSAKIERNPPDAFQYLMKALEPAARLKILIQDKSTQLYLKLDGHWTRDKEQARDFMSYLIALRFLATYPPGTLQVVPNERAA